MKRYLLEVAFWLAVLLCPWSDLARVIAHRIDRGHWGDWRVVMYKGMECRICEMQEESIAADIG